MGRSAKLYKKKPKTVAARTGERKQQSSSSSALQRHEKGEAQRRAGKAVLAKGKSASARQDSPEESELDDEVAIQSRKDSITNAEKLKSRLWKDIEAQQAKAGLSRIATPKQAGIDYMSQWEKKRRQR